MKKYLLLIQASLFCVVLNSSFAQNNNQIKLDVIKDYPVKIDGGCSFYASDTNSFVHKEYIFIVSAKKIGFIYVNNKYVLLKQVSRQAIGKNNYADLFKGDGYEIELNVAKNAKMDNTSFLYEGTMIVKNECCTVLNKVYGKVEEY